jgi:hypothetical protein
LTVNNVTVKANSATDYQRGNCTSVSVGREVIIHGTRDASGVVTATVIIRD